MEAEGMSNTLLYVARVLQEQLGDLLAGTTEAPHLRTTLEFAAQHILVSGDASSKIPVGSRRKGKEVADQRLNHGNFSEEEMMNPALWSTLPPQLLTLIFARLPLPEMKRLRLLSKVWKRRLDESDYSLRLLHSDESDFWQLWGEACTSKFALISPAQTLDSRVPAARRSQDQFWVSAFDSRTNKWHSALYKANPEWREVTVCACDGGLVCFAYKFEDLRLQMSFFTPWAARQAPQDMVRFAVWNPATGDEVAIPLLDADEEDENDEFDYYDSSLPPRNFHGLHTHPRAVHLSVDREKKQFELMVLNESGQGGNYEVNVYESWGGAWMIQEELPDRYYGYSHRCALRPLELFPRTSKGFMHYELSEGKLSFIKEKSEIHVLGEEAGRIKGVSFAVTGDRVFLLHQNEGTQVYRIAEGLCDVGGLTTVIKYHGCSPLDNLPDTDQYTLKLHSCKGFLMVSAFPKSSSRSLQQCHWFCDLLTGRWRKLPPLAEDKRFKVDDIMCELQWNIIPKQKRRLMG